MRFLFLGKCCILYASIIDQKPMKPRLLLLIFLSFWYAFARGQADGIKDNSFGTNGVAKAPASGTWTTCDPGVGITKMIVQPDGKILQVGHRQTGLDNEFVLIRYNCDGSLDLPF